MTYSPDIDTEGRSRTKLYDKRVNFAFPIVNFPFTCSNIPIVLAYGVYISDIPELVVSIMIFLIEGLLLTRKVLGQGFQVVRLKSSLRNFYGHHHVLITAYLCYKKSRMCSVGSNHNPIRSSVMAYHRLCNRSNTIGAICGSGTAYPSSAHEFAPIVSLSYWGSCCSCLHVLLIPDCHVRYDFSVK